MGIYSWLFGHISVPQEKSDLTGLITAVEEAKAYYRSQEKGIDSIKTTARSIFSAASLVVSLLGALQIFSVKSQTAHPVLFVIAVLIATHSYVLAIVFSLKVQLPLDFVTPIKMEIGELDKDLVGKSEEDVLKQQLVNYLNAIDGNKKPIAVRRKWVIASAVFFIATVVVLLLTIFFL